MAADRAVPLFELVRVVSPLAASLERVPGRYKSLRPTSGRLITPRRKKARPRSGIDCVDTGLLPEDNAHLIANGMAAGYVVAALHDGINDAPVPATSAPAAMGLPSRPVIANALRLCRRPAGPG